MNMDERVEVESQANLLVFNEFLKLVSQRRELR